MVVRARELDTVAVTISGVTTITLSNPSSGKQPVCFFVWRHVAGTPIEARFGSTVFCSVDKLLNFQGMCGPFVGPEGEDIVFASTDAAADAEFTVSYGWI